MKKHLKNKIVSAFEEETPDLRKKIESSCAFVEQLPEEEHKSTNARPYVALKRIMGITVCLLLFVVGLVAGYVMPDMSVASAETSVYLDVNPSIELQLDENNKILSVNANNDDALIILSNMELKGVKMNTALNAIIGSMYINGYLSADSNSILVSVDTNDENNTNDFLNYITEQIENVFEGRSDMELSIIAQGVNANEDLRNRAKENGVSVGKMHLVEKMIDSMDEFGEQNVAELSKMSIRELNLLYASRFEENERPENEVISGNVGGYIDRNIAVETVLDAFDYTQNEVSWFKIRVIMIGQFPSQMIYFVEGQLNSGQLFSGAIDCVTGELLDNFVPSPPMPQPNRVNF